MGSCSACLALLILCYIKSLQSTILGLDGSGWQVDNKNKTINVPAKVPGYTITALQDANIVKNYDKRYGELETRWVAHDEWTYYRKVEVPECLLKKAEIDLFLHGIDTFATIMINGERIFTLRSFHRYHRLPVKKYLKAGDNWLAIVIGSAIEGAQAARKAYPYEVPAIHAVGGMDLFNFARKTASDYGWDWGPAYIPIGVAGGVRLEAYDEPFLTGALIRQSHNEETFTLSVLSEYQVPAVSKSGGELTVEVKALGLKETKAVQFADAGRQTHEIKVSVDANAVQLWWPAGMGAQPLYDLTVTFTPEGGRPDPDDCKVPDSHEPANTITKKVGFRRVKLVRSTLEQARGYLGMPIMEYQKTDPSGAGEKQQCGGFNKVDKQTKLCKPGLRCMRYTSDWWDCKTTQGESFYFEVNGVAMYSKGTNVIPMHVVHTEVTPQYIYDLLQYAVDANMNMIRMWGGGWYQREELYQWCDEHGLLVWQEAMFACAPYPTDDEFLKQVHEEVHQQVMRLGSHPSLVIWGGNNEVETSFDWYPATRNNRERYQKDFVKLFVDTIGGVIQELDPSRPYVDSSPSNGNDPKTGQKRWGNAQDAMYGDVHHYNYKVDCQDPHSYPPSKYISEHGFQSYPSWSSIGPVTAPEDWDVNSPMTEYRQKHENGTPELRWQMSLHFRTPAKWEDAGKGDQKKVLDTYRNWLYLTQVQQMLCYETAFGTWRRWRSDPLALTMGVLYWQLNDIWPGVSWSTLNHDLRWKPSHYLVRRVFANLAVIGLMHHPSKTVRIWVVNDYPTSQKVALHIYLHSIRDKAGSACGEPLKLVAQEVPAMASTEVYSIPVRDLQAKVHDALSHSYIHVELEAGPDVRAAVPLPYPGAEPAVVPEAIPEVRSYPRSGQLLDTQDRRRKLAEVSSVTESERDSPEAQEGTISVNRQLLEVPEAGDGYFKSAATGDGGDVQVWLSNFKDMDKLSDPQLEFTEVQQVSDKEIRFTVTTKAVAVMVVMETKYSGYFSKNAFTLHPCRTLPVTFYARDRVKAEELMKSLYTHTLYHAQM